MGLTSVILEVTNPTDPSKKLKGEFLVDSGAIFTVLTKRMVEALDLKPDYEERFSLADGTSIKRSVSSAFIKYGKRKAPSPVILGHSSDTALMGVLSLEAMGLTLNPLSRKVYPMKLRL